MGRIKILITVLIINIIIPQFCWSAETVVNQSLVTPQEVAFSACTKTFDISAERLFYLAIASANANRFTIDEIQSKTGYILFTAAEKQFLASVVKKDANHSMLKITPTNNVYHFPPGVVSNFFKYIELNINETLIQIPAAN